MIVVAAATSSAIEEIRVPQKVIAKALRPGWKPRRSSPDGRGNWFVSPEFVSKSLMVLAVPGEISGLYSLIHQLVPSW